MYGARADTWAREQRRALVLARGYPDSCFLVQVRSISTLLCHEHDTATLSRRPRLLFHGEVRLSRLHIIAANTFLFEGIDKAL